MAYLCADRFSAYNGLSISATASRSSGVAPLGVVFDASATTSSTTDEPFRDLLYVWDFDDGTAGTFSYGAVTGQSKNVAVGPIAGHVYETAGTYNPTLTVFDGYASKVYALAAVIVGDPDVVFAGALTTAVSTSGDFADAQPSSTHITSSNLNTAISTYAGTGKRVVFCGGETFTGATVNTLSMTGPCYIGQYGTGKPVFRVTDHSNIFSLEGCSDVRLVDVDLDGEASITAKGMDTGTAVSQVTLVRVDAHDLIWGFGLVGSQIVQDSCTFASPSAGSSVGTYVQDLPGTLNAFIGNSLDATGGLFAMRCRGFTNSVISNNTLAGGGAGNVLKLHALSGVSGITGTTTNGSAVVTALSTTTNFKAGEGIRGTGIPGGTYILSVDSVTQVTMTAAATASATVSDIFVQAWTGVYTENFVIASNKIIGANGSAPLAIEPQNAQADERIRNFVCFGNWQTSGTDTGTSMIIAAQQGTIYNNVQDMSSAGNGHNGIAVAQRGVEPAPDDIQVLNNSYYTVDAASDVAPVVVSSGSTNVVVRNGVAWAPNASGSPTYISGTGTATGSNNSSTAQIKSATSPFTDSTPSNPNNGDFDPASYAVGGGLNTVPVYADFLNVQWNYGNTTPTIDSGALKA